MKKMSCLSFRRSARRAATSFRRAIYSRDELNLIFLPRGKLIIMAKRERGSGRAYKQKGCKRFTIQYYRNGKRIREATGTSDERAAKQKLRQRLQQMSTGTFV